MFKEYHIKNIPFVLLKDFGTLRLEAYLIDIIDEYNIPQGLFDYEKFLLE